MAEPPVHFRDVEAALRSEPPVDDALLARLLGGVEADRAREQGLVARVRALSTRARSLVASGVGLAIALLTLALWSRADLAAYPGARMTLALTTLAALLAVAVRASLRSLAEPPLSAASRTLLELGCVTLPFALAALPAAHAALEVSLAGVSADLVPRAVACFLFGAATGAPLLVLLMVLDRGAHLSPWRATLAASAAALAGNLALQLHCPLTHPLHLSFGHASIALALPVVYAAAGRIRAR